MNHLKRLFFVISLTIVLAASAFAGEVNSPPCPAPGEVNSPPCVSNQQVNDDPADQSATILAEAETITTTTVISILENILTAY